MQNLNKLIKNVIHSFSSLHFQEKIGIFVLLLITLFIALIPYAKKQIIPTERYDYQQFKKQIAEAKEKIRFHKSDKNLSFEISKKEEKTLHLHPFPFNPNDMTYNTGKALGLSDKQIRSILNYLNKGGQFYTKADFKKMYLISEEEYEILKPYLLLPDSLPSRHQHLSNERQNQISRKKIELNAADSLTLLSIRGIGPVLAHKILTYRNKLGGFSNIRQLMEIKGFDSLKFEEIKDQVTLNPFLIRKININKVDFNELKKHPYISYQLALSLINFRQTHGFFSKEEDIKQIKLMTDELYEKLLPYITVSD